MDKKYGVYICTGCGIGEALDLDGLAGIAKEHGMTAKTHEAFCGEAGRQVIKDDMANEGVNVPVICACSPRVWKEEFNFGAETLTVRANLREGAVWSAEKPSEERSQEVIAESPTSWPRTTSGSLAPRPRRLICRWLTIRRPPIGAFW